MTDPWDDFVHSAGTAEIAGYFEEVVDRRSRDGRAVSYVDPPEHWQINRNDSVEELEAQLDRGRKRDRDTAILGYLGFDAVGLFEPLLHRFPGGSPFPIGEFVRIRRARFRRTAIRSPATASTRAPTSAISPVADTLPRRRFEPAVRTLIDSIRQGDAYQIVLSHRRTFRRPPDLLQRAGQLRRSERYSYFYYLRFGDREILGASPESVVETDGPRAYVNPIAGTRPLGNRGPRRKPLAADPKELAEHRMLVDLARNDLGKVARSGSVRLLSVERLERYARLEHLVSRVGARMRPGVPTFRALIAAFPAGTVCGAPKIRATQILRRAEGTWRGPYGGTVGFQTSRESRWALAIRTAFATKERLYTAAGAGIVARSQPKREFDETLIKLAQLESVVAGKAGP